MCACGSDKRVGWRQCCNSLNLRQLYEVYVNNGMDYDDEYHFTKVVVARNKEEALTIVKNSDECYFRNYATFFSRVNELIIIDGYRITLTKL